MYRKIVVTSLLLSTILLGASVPCYAAKRAFLVGINEYKHLPFYSKVLGRMVVNLKGAANDVTSMKELLVSQYGFKTEDILVLTDSRATRAAILKSFQIWLVDGTRKGDVVLFYFSGHGTQIPDQNGDEEDGLDEAICAHDVMPRGAKSIEESGIIIDDEIGVLLRKLEGRSVVSFIDACHAGTMTRGIRGAAVSNLELTPAYTPKFIPVTIEGAQVRGRDFSVDTIPRQSDVPPGQVFIFSSLENQLSVEIAMPDGSHGALTLGLVEAMKHNKNISYKQLYDSAWHFLKDRHKLEQTR